VQRKSLTGSKEGGQRVCLSFSMAFLSLFLMGASGSSVYRGEITGRTPYDMKYKRVYQYLVKTTAPVAGRADAPTSSRYDKRREAQEYLKQAYRFEFKEEMLYQSLPNLAFNIKGTMADHWQLPSETERKGRGDCEDKAIWLYAKLLKNGFKNVRLVIGKYRKSDIIFHAWVVWYHENRIFILDPTHQSSIKELRDFGSGRYRPYYSYYHTVKWRHHL